MQPQLFCATCTTALAFDVPELSGNRWHTQCGACGFRTALEPNVSDPEELATFAVAGVHNGT